MKNPTLASLLVLTLLGTPSCIAVAHRQEHTREVIALKHASAQDMTNKLQAVYPDNRAQFVADERSNSVIVVASENTLAEIQKLVAGLDIEVK
jgi:type II secretory pathway component GspD/PulD (secretin)